MQTNIYKTHSDSIGTANKAGLVLCCFLSLHSISVWLAEDYEVIIMLFHNQTLKGPATGEMWLNIIVTTVAQRCQLIYI